MRKKVVLLLLMLLTTITFIQAQNSLLDKNIALDKSSGTIQEILDKLSQKGDFTFSYSNAIPLRKQVNLTSINQSVKGYLDELFRDELVEYTVKENKIILSVKDKPVEVTPGKKKFTLSGYVKDSTSGEVLIGATVFIQELSSGATTNTYGFYSLTIPEDTYTIQFSYVGYQPVNKRLLLTKNISLPVSLSPSATQLTEVTINSSQSENNVDGIRMGVHQLDISTLRKIPALGGEADVMRGMQLLPGVNKISEASTGLYVRGGNMDQNTVLLDEAPVYNTSHLLGLFSVFNPDIIKDIQLYKGGIPAEYGGRLSSVLDIRMKEGNAKKFGVSGGIGLLASRLTVEGPIIKEKTSFIISGRRTYPDLLLLNLNPNISGFRLNFYDLNAKVNHIFNAKNRLFLSGFFGRDITRMGAFYNSQHVKWGNATGTLRWNHLFNDKLFSNFTLLYSQYKYNLNAYPLQWKSSIEDFSLKGDFTWFINPINTLKFGIQSKYLQINPGSSSQEVLTGEKAVSVPGRHALEHAIYLSNEHKLNEKLLVEYGLRYSLFQNIGQSTVYRYNEKYIPVDTTFYKSGQVFYTNGGIEPRFSMRYKLNSYSSLKASYNRTRQYLQLLSNTTTGFTTFDIWYPSGPTVKPQLADQVTLGYFRNTPENKWEGSVEIYYKTMRNTVDYADYASLLYNPYLDAELRAGKAWAYGAEFFLRKPTGKLTGWLSYTYSKTKRRIPEINGGKTFVAGYDQPNSFSLVSQYDISKRWTLSANWVYSTGRAVTLPKESYAYGTYQVPAFGGRNASRLPDYHRLDLSATLNSKEKPNRKFESSWTFSLYNAYARKNALLIFMGPPLGSGPPFPKELDKTKTAAHKVSLFPVIPSVTYNFKF